jgi:probable HAF family extracellular repeat protein
MTIRRHAALAILFASLVSGALAQTSLGIAYKYSRLRNPGWDMVPVGINNSNVIVGWYSDPFNTHGFIYKNGVFTTVDFPGADFTEAMGINDSGDVVGSYALPTAPSEFPGFLLHQGVFTTIDFPGSTHTWAMGINNAGTIVGSYPDAKSNTHGFVYNNGTFKTVDAPHLGSNAPASTQLNGINNSGIIVGGVSQGGAVRGFWLFGKVFHFLNASGTTNNFPTGINALGDVIGQSLGISYGYSYLAFSVPTQGMSNAQNFAGSKGFHGINDARILVGNQPKVALVATPMLTLKVTSPANRTKVPNPVHVAAVASGDHAISQMEVWVNNQKFYSVAGGTLDTDIDVPAGTNQRFVIRAVDSTGIIAKVVDTITVN